MVWFGLAPLSHAVNSLRPLALSSSLNLVNLLLTTYNLQLLLTYICNIFRSQAMCNEGSSYGKAAPKSLRH